MDLSLDSNSLPPPKSIQSAGFHRQYRRMTIDLKMLGVVLLSEYNELVHAFGNQQFRQLFFVGPSYSEGNGQLSSSSGVSSSVSSHSPMGQVETPRIRTSTMEMQENDGEIEELAAIDSKKNANVDADPVVGDDQSIIDETQLLSQLMPLIALCRTRGSQMDGANQIECIHSGVAVHVQIGNLPFSNLLVLIHSKSIFNGDSFSSDRLFKTLIRCIDFHYGPQLQLISLSPKLLQNIQTRCEQRMLNILMKVDESNKSGDHPQGQNNFDYFFSEADEPFNQNISFGGTQTFVQTELMPHFRELTKIIAQQIGKRCRCLLMHSGHLIGSISSHQPSESIFTSIVASQLCSILQFARQRDCSDSNERKLKSQTEQSWIFSKTMRRRQLHNLFVFSLSEHVEIVCVALAGNQQRSTLWHCPNIEIPVYSSGTSLVNKLGNCAEQFQLVGSICECLELLEQIGTDYLSNGFPALMEKCQKHLESALKLLEAFNDWKLEWIGGAMMAMGGWSQWDYLQDVPKTKALIQFQTQISPIPSSSICSISQIANSQNHLLFASSQSLLTESSNAQQPQYNSTISSVYSTLEWSTLSAAFSTNSHLLTTHLDLIKTQMKRLLRTLLGELLTWSAGLARTKTLPRLQTAMRRSMDQKLIGTFLLFREEIARIWAKGNPLKPAHLGLDMLAYHFSKTNGPPLYFNYYGDGQRELFDQLVEIFTPTMATIEDESSSENEEIMVARTSEGQLILRLQSSTCSPMNESTASKSRKLLSKLPFGGLRKTKHYSMPNEGQKSSHQQPSYNVIILFSRFVNLTLAIKQAQKLIDVLAEQMAQSQQCFQ